VVVNGQTYQGEINGYSAVNSIRYGHVVSNTINQADYTIGAGSWEYSSDEMSQLTLNGAATSSLSWLKTSSLLPTASAGESYTINDAKSRVIALRVDGETRSISRGGSTEDGVPVESVLPQCVTTTTTTPWYLDYKWWIISAVCIFSLTACGYLCKSLPCHGHDTDIDVEVDASGHIIKVKAKYLTSPNKSLNPVYSPAANNVSKLKDQVRAVAFLGAFEDDNRESENAKRIREAYPRRVIEAAAETTAEDAEVHLIDLYRKADRVKNELEKLALEPEPTGEEEVASRRQRHRKYLDEDEDVKMAICKVAEISAYRADELAESYIKKKKKKKFTKEVRMTPDGERALKDANEKRVGHCIAQACLQKAEESVLREALKPDSSKKNSLEEEVDLKKLRIRLSKMERDSQAKAEEAWALAEKLDAGYEQLAKTDAMCVSELTAERNITSKLSKSYKDRWAKKSLREKLVAFYSRKGQYEMLGKVDDVLGEYRYEMASLWLKLFNKYGALEHDVLSEEWEDVMKLANSGQIVRAREAANRARAGSRWQSATQMARGRRSSYSMASPDGSPASPAPKAKDVLASAALAASPFGAVVSSAFSLKARRAGSAAVAPQ